MKLGRNKPIPHPINLQFKHQRSRIDSHIEREIQILKLQPLRRGKSREQRLRHRIEIRGECTDGDQTLLKTRWGNVGVAGDQIVFDDQRLTWSEIPRVVE